MSATEALRTQLDRLHEQTKPSSKRKVSDPDAYRLLEKICDTFPRLSPEERVDILISFEDRYHLLEIFVRYLSKVAEMAAKAERKNNKKAALEALQRAITADAIIDGRTNLDQLQSIQNELLETAKKVGFSVIGYLEQIITPVDAYVRRAHHLHKENQRSQAIRALGRALQLDENLERSRQIGDFAAILTGESPHSALITLEDSFLRNRFIEEVVEAKGSRNQSASRRAQTQSQFSLLRRILHGVFPGRR